MSGSLPLGACWIVPFDFTSPQKFMGSAAFIYGIASLAQAIDWNTTGPGCKPLILQRLKFRKQSSNADTPVGKATLGSCTEVAHLSTFLSFFGVKNCHAKNLYLFSLPPFKLSGLAENTVCVKCTILLALQGLTSACNHVSPHFCSSVGVLHC